MYDHFIVLFFCDHLSLSFPVSICPLHNLVPSISAPWPCWSEMRNPTTNNKSYFYGKKPLIRNEMISIKMFYYLLRFNCVWPWSARAQDREKREKNAIRMPKMHSIPFFDVVTISRREDKTDARLHRSCDIRKDKATQNALAITERKKYILHIHLIVLSAIPNSEYGQNTLWVKLHA